MGPKHIFALGLFLLLASTLYFLEYDNYSIFLMGLGVLLGSALPDLDSLLRNCWSHLRLLILLSAAFLIYFSWSGSYVICFHLLIPFCDNFILYAVLLLTALFFLFDLMSPLKPPLHGFIPMALFTLAYSILLSYARQPPAASFLSLCGFLLGYFGHIMGEMLKLNPEE